MDVQAPNFEIWLSHKPLTQDRVIVSYKGKASLNNEVEEQLQNIKLPVDNQILHLNDILLKEDMVENGVISSPFSWHYALNKPDEVIKEGHKEIVSKIRNRKDIATEAGILPWTAVALTVTSDNYFLLAHRKPGTVTIGRYSTIPGGYSNLDYKDGNCNPSLFVTNLWEFLEEVILGNTKLARTFSDDTVRKLTGLFIEEMSANGLIYADALNRGFSVPFFIKTNLSSANIDDIFRGRVDDDEHSGIVQHPFNPDSALRVIKDRKLEQHGLGALLLVGKNYFEKGEEWYKDMINYELPKNYGEILILLEDTFLNKRNVIDVLKETNEMRYS